MMGQKKKESGSIGVGSDGFEPSGNVSSLGVDPLEE